LFLAPDGDVVKRNLRTVLEPEFKSTLAQFTDDKSLIDSLWKEIHDHYTESNRHYHTLQHLQNMLHELERVKSEIKDWHCIIVALAYHDVIYSATSGINEQNSADLARKRLKVINFPGQQSERVEILILATKAHSLSKDQDVNFFTDADLSVLGKSWEEYRQYAQNVRKEYSVFPDFLYNPGRKKVLQHFLSMDRVFKTRQFYDLYEAQCKKNLQAELQVLQGD
jgi:predicted metal-dependent HD superfamily phosphohydrolase